MENLKIKEVDLGLIILNITMIDGSTHRLTLEGEYKITKGFFTVLTAKQQMTYILHHKSVKTDNGLYIMTDKILSFSIAVQETKLLKYIFHKRTWKDRWNKVYGVTIL